MQTHARCLAITIDEWDECWEDVLTVPIRPLGNNELYDEAKRLVENCSARTNSRGVGWFLDELADAQSFVVEQLMLYPDDLEWQRIHAALSGARDGLESDA